MRAFVRVLVRVGKKPYPCCAAGYSDGYRISSVSVPLRRAPVKPPQLMLIDCDWKYGRRNKVEQVGDS